MPIFLWPKRLIYMAEREGFEPPDLLQSTVFKTAALNRSATSPKAMTSATAREKDNRDWLAMPNQGPRLGKESAESVEF